MGSMLTPPIDGIFAPYFHNEIVHMYLYRGPGGRRAGYSKSAIVQEPPRFR